MKINQKKQIICTDHTVTQEKFHLEWDSLYEMYLTAPRPDEKDLAKYYESASYISHTDAKASFVDKLYQTVKNYTIKQKVKLIGSFITDDISILDIGCGTGDFLVACKNRGWEVCGIEPNDKAGQIATNKLHLLNKSGSDKIVHLDIDALVKNKRKYDVISMWHVLEHVPNLREYIEYLKSLLNPNGILIIAVPNFRSFDAEYYKEHWAAYDVPRHLWHFSKKSIDLLFKKTNLNVIKTVPMKFDSYYVSLLSEKYKTGKSNFLRAFYIGFLSNLKAIRSKEYSSLIYIIKHENS